VPIDRALTLRNAEKLIRQGKLDAGIAEYLRIVEDSPGDWNAKNTLGDLYARAGQTEKAIEQFTEIADNLSEEGSSAKAGAIFKKILKLKPDHERALLQVAEILANQKLYADARTHLNTLIELRKAKGDARGALHARVRLGSLDPEDYDARLESARARVEMGDKAGAVHDLKEIAAELAADKGRQAQAIDVLREAATLNPEDEEVKEQLFDIYLAGGELLRAREYATSVDQFRSVASAFEASLKNEVALAFFLPLVVYMADAVGTQTETVLVRRLAYGEVSLWEQLARELAIGASIGTTVAVVAGGGLWLWNGHPALAIVVGASLGVTAVVATIMASLLPMGQARLGADPALASGPVATVVQDILSVGIYLMIATVLLPM